MLKNYLKMAYRSLLKNKMSSFISLVGLSTTIACTIVLFLFIDYMFNLDSFHEQRDQIFMIESVIESGDRRETWGHSPTPLGPALAADFPQIKRAVRVAEVGGVLRYG